MAKGSPVTLAELLLSLQLLPFRVLAQNQTLANTWAGRKNRKFVHEFSFYLYWIDQLFSKYVFHGPCRGGVGKDGQAGSSQGPRREGGQGMANPSHSTSIKVYLLFLVLCMFLHKILFAKVSLC